MAKFEKKILKPGVYQSPDGEVNITPERLNHWVEQFKKMNSLGLKIPTPWGHQSSAKPASYDEKEFLASKYNAGFLEDLKIDSEGYLTTTLEVPLEEDAKRLGTVVQEVSPQIDTHWRDGKGRIWNDVITHLALVTQPVVPGQSNFEPVPEDSPLPKYALRLSLSKLKGENKMAEDKKETSTGSFDSELVELLASVHIMIPPDVKDDEEFKVALKAAVMTLKDQLDNMGEEDATNEDMFKDLQLPPLDELQQQAPPPPETPQTPEKPLTEEQPTMQMSLTKEPDTTPVNNTTPAITTEVKVEQLSDNKEFTAAKQRLSLMEKRAEEADKKVFNQRIKELLTSGRITPVMQQELLEEVKTYKLSLSDTGEAVPSMITAKVDMLEKLPQGAAWDSNEKVRLRQVAEEALPVEFATNLDDNSVDKLVEAQLRASGKGFGF